MIQIRHLETDVTTACNLSCVACNHHVPIWRERGPMRVRPEQLYADLKILAPLLHAEAWGALGGEPLLHHELVELLEIVRASGIADRIEVWTNGTLLARAGHLWTSPAWDDLVVSLYPGKFTDADVEDLKKLCVHHGKRYVPKDERNKPNFRTNLEATPTDPDTTRSKFEQCFFRRFSRNVTNGYLFTCCCAPHIPVLYQHQPFGTDGLQLTPRTRAQDVLEYLNRTEPLGACTLCAGRETATPIPWREIRDPYAWRRASQGLS